MADGRQFRKWAAQIARQAGEEPDPVEAERLLCIAEWWVSLADSEERNTNQSFANSPERKV
jgi:hypothetical protein